jgi:hypothetical protein
LLIDTELHEETVDYRIHEVATAMGLTDSQVNGRLERQCLRGSKATLRDITRHLQSVPEGHYTLIALDSFYRSIPAGVSENDNAQMTDLFNEIDATTGRIGCGWLNVHHTSKGNQANKDTTDVGSGAGAMSRAVDAHIALRRHEIEDCVVLDAALRSWAPVEPLVLKWMFPLWKPIEGLDPTALKGRGTKQEERQREKDRQGLAAIIDALRGGPATERTLRDQTGLSRERIQRLIPMLEHEGSVTWQAIQVRGNPCREYRLRE